MLMTSPPPPLTVHASVQETYSSCSSKPNTTRTHPPTPTPASLQPTPGGRPPTSPLPPPSVAAEGAYHTVNGATGGIQLASKAAPANRAAPTTAAAAIGEIGSLTSTIADATTAADYTIVCQATLAVTWAIATAAAVDGCPTFDRDANFDIGGGSNARSVTAGTRPERSSLPTSSPATPAWALEERSSGSRPIPESSSPPPRIASPTSAGSWQPRDDASDDFFVCYEALAARMIHLGKTAFNEPTSVLLVKGGNLRYPAWRATVTVKAVDRIVPRQHSEEVVAESMAAARRETPDRGGGGVEISHGRTGREGGENK